MLKQPRVTIQIAICGFFVSVIHVGKRCFSDCEVLVIRYYVSFGRNICGLYWC